MATEGSRAAALLLLEASALYRALEDTNEEEESEDEWETPEMGQLLCSVRCLTRSTVLKVAKWFPERIFAMDSCRAHRDLRISVDGFKYLLHRIAQHAAFQRTPGKQEQASIQLQLKVLLYSLQSLTYHQIAQHFGIGEGM